MYAIPYLLIGMGFALFTVGGLIEIAYDPKQFDRNIEAMLRVPNVKQGVRMSTARVRWFCLSGLAFIAVGIASLAYSVSA